ncbi:V-type ATPase 116kDa subunit family protein [Nocardia seriolae]|uniref:V-type ATP synthase subunit n=1 Tax=Nocardia seriolae TaxID=37332 RepID=A0ABC8AWG7_9NOCA|nr:V-type ATPase 116kDa subunit family protein [Nocardia seriolae]APA98436.1 V-type ATP synthase subunit [Nocardia seriolae]WNJ56124.1 V-type ATPase 116kDa subunit family protein [Nocardia seriolae]
MNLSAELTPVHMRRVAVLAPAHAMRAVLLEAGRAGVVQLDRSEPGDHPGDEAELRALTDAAVRRRAVSAVAGWCPATELPALTERLASLGASVIELPSPPGVDPPTLLSRSRPLRRAFAPLVGTYGVVPYRDLDPTVPAGIAYVVMFGMMFGDAGQGLLVVLIGALLRTTRRPRFAGLRPLWPFIAGAGAAATVFGALYGEFFGPTGVLPVLWLSPLDSPMPLLGAAVAVGAVLLALAYGVGAVNRWREGGPRLAFYSASGIAGAATFLGLGLVAAGLVVRSPVLDVAGAVVVAAGLTLSATGMFTESGGGATGAVQTGIGLFDLVIRIGSNLISFCRLAAFGMTHAALGWVVWSATVGTVHIHLFGPVIAVVVFLIGNAVTFALEALVAGVQALRLEYYELFSRVFLDEGHPFTPWRIHDESTEEPSC